MLKNKKLRIFLAIIVLSVFFLPYLASAQGGMRPTSGAWGVCPSIDCFIDVVLSFIRSVIIALIGLVGHGLSYILSANIIGVDVVKNSWEIVRNFVNMFFIIILIVMAFGTIFNVSGYDVRSLIAKFIIAALLVNFSLVIGEIIIDWSQSLSNIFIQSMGDVGLRFGQGLDIQARVTGKPASASGTNFFSWMSLIGGGGGITAIGQLANIFTGSSTNIQAWSLSTNTFINIILASIFLFSLGVAFIFSLIRIPILWALLIFSPVAWASNILPKTKFINQMWWKYFLGWNSFLPIYLFFLYLASLFLQQQQSIVDQVLSSSSGQVLPALGDQFQLIFFYTLIAIILISGAKFAMSGGMAAGAGGVALGIWGKGVAMRRAAWRGTGVPGAYKEAKEHIQKEGFAGTPLEKIPIIGGYRGQRGLEDRQAWIAGKLGIPGVADQQLQRNIQGAEERFKKQRYDQATLERTMLTGKPEERIAAAKVLKDQYRDLSGDEVTDIYNQYGGTRSPMAAKFLREQNYEKFSREELDKMETGITDVNLHQRIAQAKAKKNMFRDSAEFERYLGLFTRDSERADFIRNSKEFRDTLGKGDATKIFGKLTDKESKREFATMMLEKGHFDHAQLEQIFDNATGSTTGIYESDPERERHLDIAKKSNLLDALKVKRKLKILKDLNTKSVVASANPDDDIDTVLRQELDRMDTDAILAQKFTPASTLGGPTGLADPRMLRILEQSLANSRPERVGQFYRNNKYTGNLPLQGIIEPTLDASRLATLRKEKILPLMAILGELTTKLIPEIEKHKAAGNKVAQNAAAQTTKFSLDRANGLVKDITSSPIAPQKIKDDAINNLTPVIIRYNNAKK